MVMNLRLSPEPVLLSYMAQLQEFTSLLVGDLETYHNSLTYLLHFWSVLAQDLARSVGESLREAREFMEKVVMQITNQYIRQRLGLAEEFLQNLKDDVLCDMDSVFWEMKYIGLLLRYKLDLGSKLVSDLYDALLREYNVGVGSGCDAEPSANRHHAANQRRRQQPDAIPDRRTGMSRLFAL